MFGLVYLLERKLQRHIKLKVVVEPSIQSTFQKSANPLKLNLLILLLSVVTDNLEHTKFKRGNSSEARTHNEFNWNKENSATSH